MELILVNMVGLCVIICFLLSPSAVSLHIHIPSPNPHHQAATNVDSPGHDDPLQVHSVLVPIARKLKLAETAQIGRGETSSITGRVYKKGEKWGEEEEDKMSDFMGMDYARVRRRRHIHNKFLHDSAAP